MKVLIAEDDPISRRLLEASLTKWGFDVTVTRGGNEAWQVLQKSEPPPLTLLDWMMPGMDGVEVCRKIRAKKNAPYVYVILLTAKGRKEDIVDGLDAGADDYVTKPFSAKELRARVKVGERVVTLERKLAENVKKLKQLDKLKSDFLSTVSHELRTPIAIMREGVSLCLDGVAGDLTDMQREFLSDTLENVDRLTRLVTDLLDISKIEAGKVTLRKSSIDLCEIVKKAKKSFKQKAGEKNIKLELHLPETPIKLFADGDKVTQIFNNLVSNALRYTEKGKITITVEDKKETVECCVSDTGIGIAKENIPKLFSKFEQFGRVEGPGYKGTGLGLAIIKGLVEKHGGRVWVESELGKGSSFWFTLKKVQFPRILVVDDEQNTVEIVKRFLSVGDYRFIEAYDGKKAIEKAIKENPSLIVLDMMLPEMNGYEVIEGLKRNEQTHNIPILILSAFTVDRERLDNDGNSHKNIPVMEKPIKPEELLNNVQDMLST